MRPCSEKQAPAQDHELRFHMSISGVSHITTFVLNEIPPKFALIEYVLECASDVGCCMKPPQTIGGSQKKDMILLAHACSFCCVGMVFA